MDQQIRVRVSNACDSCKARKVRCDGLTPCGYCSKRQKPLICRYSPQKRRRKAQNGPSSAHSTPGSTTPRGHPTHDDVPTAGVASLPVAPVSSSEAADEPTDVDLAGRLVKDAHGKLVFIGDCAPLSFYQSIRRILSNTVDVASLSHQHSRASLVQNQSVDANLDPTSPPPVRVEDVEHRVQAYYSLTTSLVDLFAGEDLSVTLTAWARLEAKSGLSSAVFYLVLANSASSIEDSVAQRYFSHAKHQALDGLSGDLSIETVQAFILITLYLLKACQTNAAFMFLGIAARAAYAIGIHRTEANAMFGEAIGRQRDQIWKSLRAVDLFLSTSMGRPPATSDVDCTVPYSSPHDQHGEACDLLNAHVQILLIVEDVVLEVYSRKKITLAITEGLSGQLRDWSNKWLRRLQEKLASVTNQDDAQINGACQVLCSYYYANQVMLVSRPFLMYEACRRLSEQPHCSAPRLERTDSSSRGKAKLADACIDAASMLADTVQKLIERQTVSRSMPLLISWLFASSLALGLGLLCGCGRILERYGRTCVAALNHFAKTDSLATHYSVIGRSLVDLAIKHLEQQELRERKWRTESSSQLFGLVSSSARNDEDQEARSAQVSAPMNRHTPGQYPAPLQSETHPHTYGGELDHPGAADYSQENNSHPDQLPLDLSLFDGLFDDMSPTDWSGINLFPVLENEPQMDFPQYI